MGRLLPLVAMLCLAIATGFLPLTARAAADDSFADWPEQCRPAIRAFTELARAIDERRDQAGDLQTYFAGIPPDYTKANWARIEPVFERSVIEVTNQVYGTDLKTTAEVTAFGQTLPPSDDRGAMLFFFPAFHRNLQDGGFTLVQADFVVSYLFMAMGSVSCGGKTQQ